MNYYNSILFVIFITFVGNKTFTNLFTSTKIQFNFISTMNFYSKMDFTKYTLIPFLFAKKDLLFDFIK